MRRLIAMVFVGLAIYLVAACSNDDVLTIPVWTVVETQETYDASFSIGRSVGFELSIDYIGPTAEILTWKRASIGSDADRECWSTARLGEPLPTCARGAVSD